MQKTQKVICTEILTEDQRYKVILFDEKRLGKGSFGQCYLGFYPCKGQLVVIKKIFRDSRKPSNTFIKDYEREIDNLYKASLNFRVQEFSNIVNVQPLKIVSNKKTHAYMIMQYCQGGSLQNLIQNMNFENIWFSFQDVCTIILDILDGYNQFYSLGIIHQDLKPDNIFINNNKFKIGDFGLSYKLNDEKPRLGGTPHYNAPQKYKKNQLNVKSDIYSLGIIFYELIYNQHPYYTLNEKLQFQNKKAELQFEGVLKGIVKQKFKQYSHRDFIKTWSLKFHQPKVKIQKKQRQIFQKTISFIKQLIDLDDKKRPTFQQIMLKKQNLNIKKTKIFVQERKIEKKYQPIIVKQSTLAHKQISQFINYFDDQQIFSQQLQMIKKKTKRINMMTFLLFDLTISLKNQLRKVQNYTPQFKYVAEKLQNLNYILTYKEYCSILKDLNNLKKEDKRQFYSKGYCNIFNNTKNNKCFLQDQIEHYFHLRRQSIQHAYQTIKNFLDQYVLKAHNILDEDNKILYWITKLILDLVNLGPFFTQIQVQKINQRKFDYVSNQKGKLQQINTQLASSGIHFAMINLFDD